MKKMLHWSAGIAVVILYVSTNLVFSEGRDEAPYDVIVLNGASEVVPKTLLRQLKPGGRLVGVLGRGPAGKATLYRSIGGECGGRPIFDAAAPLLPGFAAAPAFVF